MAEKSTPLDREMRKMDRRRFIGESAAAAAAFSIVPRHVLGGPGYIPPSETINIGVIGVGGRGGTNLGQFVQNESCTIAALCDADDTKTAAALERFPDVPTYRDFRRMLERERGLDAVVVSTPDHIHAVASVMAMKMGKHVYCEKPLTWCVHEARVMAQVARETGVVTQMGNQGHANETARWICEWVWGGAIGNVTEVHTWTNRPIWPQGIDRPEETPPVPSTLDWDLWLGPAPWRPYHPAYQPFNWRGWWDFGTGALGDMACHIVDFPVWALKLGYPISVEASSSGMTSESYPVASIVRYKFPAREGMPPVEMTWWDGGLMPPRAEELTPEEQMGNPSGGGILIGDRGKIMYGCYSDGATLLPTSRMEQEGTPEPVIPRSIGHHAEWIEAIKGGPPTASNFEVAGPLTEIILLGCVAIRRNRKLEWDGPNMTVTNDPEANQYIKREYREGWTL